MHQNQIAEIKFTLHKKSQLRNEVQLHQDKMNKIILQKKL